MILVCHHCQGLNRVPDDKLGNNPICGKCKQAVLADSAIEVDSNQFQRYLSKSELPVVVDFWASWCGPCQMMAPIFNKVANEMKGKAVFLKVNTETEQALAAQFNIRSIPALKIFRNGKVVDEMAGALPEMQMKSWVEQACKC